jgi:hypothetical protein
MPEAKTYTGGCHCGRVRYRVTTDLARVLQCNCSICTKRGLLLTFVKGDAFELVADGGGQTDYQFHKHFIHHTFCPVCGVEAFAHATTPDGAPMYGVNVRCLDDVDLAALTLTPYDGKSR